MMFFSCSYKARWLPLVLTIESRSFLYILERERERILVNLVIGFRVVVYFVVGSYLGNM